MRTANSKSTNVTKMDLATIKSRLEEIYNSNPLIHVSVHEGRTKLNEVPSTISGVYNHFMCVTAHVKNYQDESFTINFIDILIGKYKIKELDELTE